MQVGAWRQVLVQRRRRLSLKARHSDGGTAFHFRHWLIARATRDPEGDGALLDCFLFSIDFPRAVFSAGLTRNGVNVLGKRKYFIVRQGCPLGHCGLSRTRSGDEGNNDDDHQVVFQLASPSRLCFDGPSRGATAAQRSSGTFRHALVAVQFLPACGGA